MAFTFRDMTRPTAIMLVGLPGSGKSTWMAPYLLRGYGIVSTDDYIEKMAQSMGKTYGDIFKTTIGAATKWMDNQFNIYARAAQNIVWDQTNLSMKSRRKKLNQLTDAGYNVIAVAFEIPTNELTKRREHRERETGKKISESVLEEMGKSYQRPTRLEGFSKVYIVTANGEFEGG